MVDKLLNTITKKISLHCTPGINIDGVFNELGDNLFLVYCKKEIYACNHSINLYMGYLGIPEDIYIKYRRDIIRHIISKSSVNIDYNAIVLLMRETAYILDKENKIDEFSFV